MHLFLKEYNFNLAVGALRARHGPGVRSNIGLKMPQFSPDFDVFPQKKKKQSLWQNSPIFSGF